MKAQRSGQGLVEYVLVIALVAIALVAVMLAFRDSVGSILDTTTNDVVECATPGQGGTNPGHGGDAPGQCKKAAEDQSSIEDASSSIGASGNTP